jgi:hypothetical protein
MKKLIFLGPSLPLAAAKAICGDAVFLAPAAQADVVSAIANFSPGAIGLIDGVFSQDLSVWHKEILFALSEGITVMGASSMGALRAAETERFGMIGVGQIFRMYANGAIVDDDEVALVHGPAGLDFIKLTEPMVNVRATLTAACNDGLLDKPQLAQLLAVAKKIHFTRRTWDSIFAAAGHVDQLRGLSQQSLRT